MRGSRSQSQEVQLLGSAMRDRARQDLVYLASSRLNVLIRMIVRDVSLLLFTARSLDSRSEFMVVGLASLG